MKFKHKAMLTCVLLTCILASCYIRDVRWHPIRPPRAVKAKSYRLETTGYCKCGHCCGWKRNLFGRPVHRTGPNKGNKKIVGMTASGEMALRGTLAADTTIFPFGTIIHIPGYGYGRVEDRGSDIKGYHIDLYFSSHQEALTWGRQRKNVEVWLPDEKLK